MIIVHTRIVVTLADRMLKSAGPKARVNDVRDGLRPYLAVDAVTALRTGNRTFPRVL